MQTYKLNNGISIPSVGFGTWQTPSGNVAAQAVKTALQTGYAHIDTAAVYENETGVGQGLRESGKPRPEIFITSKVWNSERGYNATLRAFAKTLDDLQLDYLDLYLIHWPDAKNPAVNIATWQAMETLYKDGKIKALGVSNFKPKHLQTILDTAEIKPAVNQIEFHPGHLQKETVEFCRQHDILIEAWAPLGTGRMLTNAVLQNISGKYQKSVAQLCIRWCLQHGVLPLPKSVTPARIAENLQVFDFTISEEDMQTIDALPDFGWSNMDPDTVPF